ncbi:MAG: DUF4294 domain-containing protein [Bacteroidales bacterium]|nr:DUF4294 domain-containing protein [Bacteroidales bacterium]
MKPAIHYLKNEYFCIVTRKILTITLALILLIPGAREAAAQNRGYMTYIVENGDTVFVDVLRPAYTYTGKKKGRQWRKYYKLVHNFSKTYPFAIQVREMMHEVDSTIAADKLRRRKKDKYIAAIQKKVLDNYEPVIRKMTVSQGKLLIQLIGRETGLTPYEIIKDYKNGVAAGFWQGIAKFFGGDLKRPYDPNQEDKAIEDLVKSWENDTFEGLYYSIFGTYPPEVKLVDLSVSPSKKK